MNEETILEKRPTNAIQTEEKKRKKNNNAWVNVTLGGVTGILMGAGLMHAGHAFGHSQEPSTNPIGGEEKPTPLPEDTTNIHIAQVNQDLSFGEAFAIARAEVGPGGVFVWHGGVYNTFTAEEWNTMTPAERDNFANHIHVHSDVNQIHIPTDDNVNVVLISSTDDVVVVNQQTAENFDFSDDVHVVGYSEVDGHLAVGYDSNGDGNTDVVIIDVDDNHRISDSDVIVNDQGDVATVEELVGSIDDSYNDNSDIEYLTSLENPDVASDMPDYMNDAMFDI